jgi:hypothetical protein
MPLAGGQKAVLILARLYLLAAHPILTFRFVRKLGFWPNPAFPKRYHEKVLWRKIVDRNPSFVSLSDKLAAKQIARSRCPGLAIAEVLWTGEDPQSLPMPLVAGDVAVKANHGCGANIFVADGKPACAEIVTRAEQWIAKSYHRRKGEWGYRDVPRRIFVEERLALGGGDLPTDIKVHVFGGRIGHVWAADKISGRSRTYSADLAPLAVRDGEYPGKEQALPDSPATRALIARALDFAPRLLDGLDYARVDFMVAGDRLYFGEYTLYPGGGYDRWLDSALTERAEALWDLRTSDFLRRPNRGLARLYAEALRAAIDKSDLVICSHLRVPA